MTVDSLRRYVGIVVGHHLTWCPIGSITIVIGIYSSGLKRRFYITENTPILDQTLRILFEVGVTRTVCTAWR